MILTQEQFFSALHARVGSDTSDEGIQFLEDMTDTYNSLAKKASGDGNDWEKRYHELDESWKKRYRHRFFNGADTNVPPEAQPAAGDDYNPDAVTVDNLFN